VVIATIQVYLFLGLALLALGIEVWALADAGRRPAHAFTSEGKRTKQFWVWVLVAACVGGFLGLPPPLGLGLLPTFLMIIAVVPAGVYLADVRPAVRGYGPGGGRRPPRGGGW
jgi:hypothetical protein